MKKKNKEALKKENNRIAELENQLKRALADYVNLQKRIEQERFQVIRFAKAEFISKLLTVLDTFEEVEKIIQREEGEEIKTGFDLALSQLKSVLKEEGIEEISTDGLFDPNFHEAVEVVQGENDDRIVGVVQKGYKIDDKILRPAKVNVAKKSLEEISKKS